jgi:D-hydroxyproline dehydrogenase subunit beta
MNVPTEKFDLAVVGAGIVGLACALAAARRKLKVVVIERGSSANGASIRNFGFVTVTGQDPTSVWRRAQRTRDIWLEVATDAHIEITQRGTWLPVQRPEAAAVLEAFMHTESAAGCELLPASDAQQRCPQLGTKNLQAALWSPHELRVESREAIPQIARWLAERHGVAFRWGTAVHAIEGSRVETSHGPICATSSIVCPGDDFVTLFPERHAAAKVGRCQLQMLRLENPGFRFPGTLMTDLSLIRYEGFAHLPEAKLLRTRLEEEQREYLERGIHLIVAQSADGSLVVGDSHRYDSAPPFANERIDRLILEEYHAATGHPPPPIRERWMGTYATEKDRVVFIDAPAPNVRLLVVTSGIGASTGFALGEEVIHDLFQ